MFNTIFFLSVMVGAPHEAVETSTAAIVLEPEAYAFCIVRDFPLDAMIEQGGYDRVASVFIADYFWDPRGGKVCVEVHLARLNRPEVADRELLAAIAGYRPALMADLLGLGAWEPELQRQFTIVADTEFAGETGVVAVPYLGLHRGLRALLAMRRPRIWRRRDIPNLRFAVVRLPDAAPVEEVVAFPHYVPKN